MKRRKRKAKSVAIDGDRLVAVTDKGEVVERFTDEPPGSHVVDLGDEPREMPKRKKAANARRRLRRK